MLDELGVSGTSVITKEERRAVNQGTKAYRLTYPIEPLEGPIQKVHRSEIGPRGVSFEIERQEITEFERSQIRKEVISLGSRRKAKKRARSPWRTTPRRSAIRGHHWSCPDRLRISISILLIYPT